MRSIVCAYSDVGYACLETLLDLRAEIAAVFTHDDDPAEEIWFRSVRRMAEEHGLPVFAPERLGADWVDRLRTWQPDFLFSFYYRRLLPAAVLETARLGALNLHGSLLPRYRGRSPVNWVLINGERETGVTLHYMVARADAGDIVGQRRVPIADDDTAYSLYGKQTAAATELLREMYPRLCAGSAPRVPQDHTRATYCGGRRPPDGVIDWTRSAREVYDLVRAVTHPYPGAFTAWRGRQLLIWAAQIEVPDGRPRPPGTVVGTDHGVVVQAGAGRVRALRVQLAGEDETEGGAWARQHGVAEGMQLG